MELVKTTPEFKYRLMRLNMMIDSLENEKKGITLGFLWGRGIVDYKSVNITDAGDLEVFYEDSSSLGK